MTEELPPLSAFPEEPEHPGHLLPEEDWRRVVEEAEREAERIERGQPPPEAPETRGRTTGALAVSGVVTAASHGGTRGRPTFGVLHSAETPLRAGYAASIARYFAGGPGTSCHYMTDPAETWGVLPDELIAWHVGTANTRSVGLEQSGYASYSRSQWLAAEGMAQLRRNAAVMRACRDRYGIGLWWMSDQQLRDAHAGRITGGWSTHDQCRRVIGGTTHTDPGTGFPFDVQMQLAAGEDEDMFSWTDVPKAQRDAFLIDVRDNAVLPLLRDWFGAMYDAVNHHGRDDDNAIGHAVSAHKFARAAYDLLTTGTDRGAGTLTPAMLGDPAAIAAALAPALIDAMPDGDLSTADVEKALRNVLGSLG